MDYDKELSPITVDVRDGDALGALKALQKRIGEEGIVEKMKDQQHYTKPSKERHNRKRRIEREREQARDDS